MLHGSHSLQAAAHSELDGVSDILLAASCAAISPCSLSSLFEFNSRTSSTVQSCQMSACLRAELLLMHTAWLHFTPSGIWPSSSIRPTCQLPLQSLTTASIRLVTHNRHC